MQYEKALKLAQEVARELAPHCIKIAIAGSIRRQRPNVNDIEIVAIPKPYDTGLFESGIATVVNKWDKAKGELPCKYTQRILPGGEKLDLFFADHENWGYIYAIRTGSADWAHQVLAKSWTARGYKGIDGYLTHGGKRVIVAEEQALFKRIGLDYVSPKNREI